MIGIEKLLAMYSGLYNVKVCEILLKKRKQLEDMYNKSNDIQKPFILEAINFIDSQLKQYNCKVM